MKQNFFMVYFLGVPLGGRIVLHTFKWQNLHKKNLSVPPSVRLISIRWNGSKNYKRCHVKAHTNTLLLGSSLDYHMNMMRLDSGSRNQPSSRIWYLSINSETSRSDSCSLGFSMSTLYVLLVKMKAIHTLFFFFFQTDFFIPIRPSYIRPSGVLVFL
jgi:hypothetical protein